MFFTKRLSVVAAFLMALYFFSCGTKQNSIEDLKEKKQQVLEKKPVHISVEPFHEQLWAWKKTYDLSSLRKLENEQGTFFQLYCKRIINVGSPKDPKFDFYLGEFLKDPSVTQIYEEVLKQNPNFTDLEKQLSEAFTLYHFYFPDRVVPRVKTFVSGFNYGIVATDSVLGIGLDMFLGKKHSFYKMVNIPDYLSYFMDKQYLLTECVKGWVETEFSVNDPKNDLLSEMIMAGKNLYLTDVFLPEAPDTIKIRYTAKQWDWIKQNEAHAWQQLIAKQTLFTTDHMEKRKYMGEAPFTSGFPRQSPPRLGQYFGWMIVRAFMENSPEYTPQKLMQEQNAQLILNKSKYKPSKSMNS